MEEKWGSDGRRRRVEDEHPHFERWLCPCLEDNYVGLGLEITGICFAMLLEDPALTLVGRSLEHCGFRYIETMRQSDSLVRAESKFNPATCIILATL